ncbi:MAG TPA: response regulator, partial [Gemmatimonadota bacterium]|nr:response regulator [Gemmatimonadota bacterium]
MARKLLSIDSDAATRRLVGRVLATGGFQVVEAATLLEGHDIAARTPLDVVLVDVDMPGIVVDDIIPDLTSEGAPPVFLAATADDRAEHLAHVKGAGFIAVLVKPLDIDSLAADLGRHLPAAPARVDPEDDGVRSGPAVGYRPLWTTPLTLLTANLVKNVAMSEGVLALLNETGDVLVVAAAHSLRSGVVLPVPGTEIPRAEVAWLDRALSHGEPAVPDPEDTAQSRVFPPESSEALGVPVTDNGRTYGVVVLGERRKRMFGLPPAQVAQGIAEAGKVAAVVRQFEQLDEVISERRREIDAMRIATALTVAAPGGVSMERTAFVRLSARLGERLGLPRAWRPVLEQAHQVYDLGRVWLGRTVLPISVLPAAESQKLLDDHPDQTLEILTALDCPARVIDVV